jgi:hypothetical protein
MSSDQLPIAIILGVIAVSNVLILILLRATLSRLVEGVVRFHGQREELSEPGRGTHGGQGPLQDAFEQYSALTLRMADLVFRLIDSRQRLDGDAGAVPGTRPSPSELAAGVLATTMRASRTPLSSGEQALPGSDEQSPDDLPAERRPRARENTETDRATTDAAPPGDRT